MIVGNDRGGHSGTNWFSSMLETGIERQRKRSRLSIINDMAFCGRGQKTFFERLGLNVR